jgi:hypothetical protein
VTRLCRFVTMSARTQETLVRRELVPGMARLQSRTGLDEGCHSARRLTMQILDDIYVTQAWSLIVRGEWQRAPVVNAMLCAQDDTSSHFTRYSPGGCPLGRQREKHWRSTPKRQHSAICSWMKSRNHGEAGRRRERERMRGGCQQKQAILIVASLFQKGHYWTFRPRYQTSGFLYVRSAQ